MISAGAENSTAYRDFRAVLAVHQRTLVSIMAMQGSGITTPKDLEGKRIAAAANSVNQLLFPGYAKLAGIDTAKIRWIAVQPVQLGPALAGGKADALSTFLIGRPTVEKATVQARSKHVVVFPYSTYLPAHGNDPTWAGRVPAAMLEAGLTDVDTVIHSRSWPGGTAGALLIAGNIAQTRGEFLAAGMTEAQLDELDRLVTDPRLVVRGHFTYSTIGRRPPT
ncbi:ABC transporter substrate-binding protein [Streptomyces sp. NPDC101776]|uniref:ABC transporter substrate-binding protein n=1 Tax=Streptomyces sp. NPDC101776 TaxID=3366146 RepID=UPI0037FD46E8